MAVSEKDVGNQGVKDGNIVSTEEKRLTLAYEDLTDLPNNLVQDYGCIVEILDLSHNKLSNVEFLANFKSLTTLILDHNCLTSDAVFPLNRNMNTLWLNNNSIDKLHPFVQKLSKSFPNLKLLSLMGNAAAPSYLNGGTYYEYIQYRLFVIASVPQLEYLDDRVITEDQRTEAKRLFGRSFYSILVDEQIPEFFDKVISRFRSRTMEESVTGYVEEHECAIISSNPNGNETGRSYSIASIPVSSQTVYLNSSDSESSISLPRRKKPRNLII